MITREFSAPFDFPFVLTKERGEGGWRGGGCWKEVSLLFQKKGAKQESIPGVLVRGRYKCLEFWGDEFTCWCSRLRSGRSMQRFLARRVQSHPNVRGENVWHALISGDAKPRSPPCGCYEEPRQNRLNSWPRLTLLQSGLAFWKNMLMPGSSWVCLRGSKKHRDLLSSWKTWHAGECIGYVWGIKWDFFFGTRKEALLGNIWMLTKSCLKRWTKSGNGYWCCSFLLRNTASLCRYGILFISIHWWYIIY